MLQKLQSVANKPLSHEEREVLVVLLKAYQVGNRVTQRDIATSVHWMGGHEVFEGERSETTLRKVRQIVRDLRIKYLLPILSDRDGYWIPKDENDAKRYLTRIEKQAKAQAKAWFETYKSMRESLGMTSDYFESQQHLFV